MLANPPKSQQPKANNALQDLDGLDGHNQLPKLIFRVNSSAGLRLSPSRPAVGSQPPPPGRGDSCASSLVGSDGSQLRAMTEFRFDPPLTLKGNVVARNLDDAVRFMIGYRVARRPALQTSVLYRLEGAAGEEEERHAGYAVRGWAEAEGLGG